MYKIYVANSLLSIWLPLCHSLVRSEPYSSF